MSKRSILMYCRMAIAAFTILAAGACRAEDWTPLWATAHLSQPRDELAATSAGGKVFFAGGGTSDPSNVVDIYDTASGTWSTATLSQARYGLVATAVDGKVLFAGGETGSSQFSNVVDIYDTTSGSWSTATLSIGRTSLAATTVGDMAYFGGGDLDTLTHASNVIDVYDAVTNSWSTTALSQGRFGLAAASVDGKVIFAGGASYGPSPSAVVDIYDTTSGAWSAATLAKPRDWLAAASAGGKVFFDGGQPYSTTVDVYDATAGTWSTLTLPDGHYLQGSAAVGSKVLFGGGYTGTTLSSTVDIFDTATNLWSTATLSQPRQKLVATSAGNQVFFAGGDTYQNAASDVVDIYTLQSYPSISSAKAWTLVDQTTVSGLMQLSGSASLGLGTYNLAVGSMSGTAPINLSSNELSVGSDNTSTTYSGAIGGSGGQLLKLGSGTLTLSGSNTYTGPTTISQGELAINGLLGSPVAVNSGGTLGGTGHLSSGTVSAGGYIAPGNSPQGLSFSGGLFLASGAEMDYALDTPSTSDEISCGSLLVGSPLGFSNFDFTLTANFGPGNYNLIEAGSVPSGTLGTSTSGTIEGLPANLAVQGNDLVLTVVPEPSTLVLLAGGGPGLASYVWRRRAMRKTAKPARRLFT